jgi:hypothetical protein
MRGNLVGQRTQQLAPEVGQDRSRRARYDGRTVQGRQRTAALLRQRLARLADRIRSSTEVMGGEARPDQRGVRDVPWLGLLLWVFACAALFVSLIMRPGDLDQDRRVAARSVLKEQRAGLSAPMPSWSPPTSELGVFTVRRPPSR